MTRLRSQPTPTVRAALGASLAALLVACSQAGAPTHPAVTSSGPRPSTSATVEIVEPASSTTVSGTTTHVVLRLNGATIVPQTTTAIRADQGHVHLYVNGVLVSMNYGLEQDIPVQPGTLLLKAEFVAADHAPFNPRVWSRDVVFTVKP